MIQNQLMKQHEKLIEEAARKISEAYDLYYESVVNFLLDAMIQDGAVTPKFSEAYVYSTLNIRREQLEQYLVELVNEQMEDAFLLGVLFFEQSITANAVNHYDSAVIKQETVQLLQEVTRNTDMRLKRLVREAYQAKLFERIAQRRQQLLDSLITAKQFQELLEKEGFVGIVDKANRRWKPDVYAKMVFRTKVMEANIAIQQEQGRQFGVDLAYVAGVPVDNPCNNWIGVIVSLNGMTVGFPSYQQVKDTGEIFHPNCQHYLIPIRTIDQAPMSVITKTEQKYGMDLSHFK